MDRTPVSLWAKHLIRASIDYFNERTVQACLIVDNSVLKDGVLASLKQESDDFIICVAPGFTTQLDFDETELNIAVKFDNLAHVMSIPYNAVKAVIAANSGGVLTEDGHMNIISIPPVIYPPASRFRNEHELAEMAQKAADAEMHAQPGQDELQLVAKRRS
jgi:stringent starvation protein B